MNKVTPHLTFMRRTQNADTYALKQPRLSQNISPVCSSFVPVIASDMRLESESEKRAKNVDLHTAKNIQLQSTLFRYFETNSYKLTSDLFTVVWPPQSTLTRVSLLRSQQQEHLWRHFPYVRHGGSCLECEQQGKTHTRFVMIPSRDCFTTGIYSYLILYDWHNYIWICTSI